MSSKISSTKALKSIAVVLFAVIAGCGDEDATGAGSQAGDTGTPIDAGGQMGPPAEDSPLAGGMLTNIGGPQDDGSVLADNLHLLDWGLQHDDVVVGSETVLVPRVGNEALLRLREGDLIASPTNGGFLREVTAVDETNGAIIIWGSSVEIFDAVVVGGLDTQLDLTTGGTPLLNALVFDALVLNESLVLEGGTSVDISGNVSFSPTADLSFDADEETLAFSISGPLVGLLEVDAEASVSETATLSARLFESRRSFHVAQIGLLPVILTATVYVDASVTARSSVAGGVSMGVQQTVHVDETISYDPNRGPDPWLWTSGTTYDDPEPIALTADANAELSVTVAVTPGVDLTFYWSGLGVGTSLPIELEGRVSTQEDSYACDSGITVRLRGEIAALVPSFASDLAGSWTFLDIEQRLADLSETAEFQEQCCGGVQIGGGVTPPTVETLRDVEAMARCEVLAEPDGHPVNTTIRDDDGAALGQGYDRDESGQAVVEVESIREIDGDLRIDVRRTAVRLPNLVRVAGDLSIVGIDEAGDDGVPSIELPSLRQVGGTLEISWGADPSALGIPRLDLSSLADLGAERPPGCPNGCSPGGSSVYVGILGTPTNIHLPALNFNHGAGEVRASCGGSGGLAVGVEAVATVTFGSLTSATSIYLGNGYYQRDLSDGTSEPIRAFRDCWFEFPNLDEVVRYDYPEDVYPEDVDPEDVELYEPGTFEIRGDVGYDVPNLIVVDDRIDLVPDELPRETNDASESVPGFYFSALEAAERIELGFSPESSNAGRIAGQEYEPPPLGEVRFPALIDVGYLSIYGGSIESLDLSSLETIGNLELYLDENLATLELPELLSLGNLVPRLLTVDDVSFYEDTPVLDAPLLAEVVGTLHLNFSSGDHSYSLPALETAGTLTFNGPGFVALSLPALVRADHLEVSNTLLRAVPTVPRGASAASITIAQVSGNPQLSECAVRLFCEQLNVESCWDSDNLDCVGECVGGVCQ